MNKIPLGNIIGILVGEIFSVFGLLTAIETKEIFIVVLWIIMTISWFVALIVALMVVIINTLKINKNKYE